MVVCLACACAPGLLAADLYDTSYHTHAELSARVNRLAVDHPRLCAVHSIGTSREGRAIWVARLAGPGDVEPDRRPALLVVASLDGDHLVGSEVALGVAERLLTKAADGDETVDELLNGATIYIVPRVNPDAVERYFDGPRLQRRRNMRPDDRDRDGVQDEDAPDDLNGDGLITMMRVFDPDKADMMPDGDEPRLDIKADPDKGQRALYTLYDEGLDDDGDGEYNEDPVGGVDLNMNFMHGYREHADGAGPHQVSEPESLALLRFVLGHQNIAVVLTYGRHDTLSETPDGKGTHPSGAPKSIAEKDVGLYKHLGERFREITGLEKVSGDGPDGSFFVWAYSQFGVPSLATPLWTRPEPKKEEKEEGEAKPAEGGEAAAGSDAGAAEGDDEGAGLTPSGIGDISMETIEELRAAAEARGFQVTDEMVAQLSPSQAEGFAKQMGIEIRRVKGAKGAGGGASKGDLAWLAYSDKERDGAGFVNWTEFDHPQLGKVEIGGWVPYFKVNPPPGELAGLADRQVEFILDLGSKLPAVSLSEPEVVRLAAGLYEIKSALVNDGYLPTGTAMAVRNRRARPYVVRLSVDDDRIVTGNRVNKIWSIPGSGGRAALRWIIRADDGAEITITVYSEKFGQFERTLWMKGESS